MKLAAIPLLADENIDPQITAGAAAIGLDIMAAAVAGLIGYSDLDVIRHATGLGRAVLTHDADFGKLAVQQGEPLVGIVYLRPGHVGPQPTIDTLQQLLAVDPDLTPPFLLVAKRTGSHVRIRIRSLAPPTGGAP